VDVAEESPYMTVEQVADRWKLSSDTVLRL